jgi:hypothetical protein
MAEVAVLTLEKAREIKSILDQIRDSIPSTLVDYVYVHWKMYLAPNAGKPCSCNPKPWIGMLEGLRNLVNDFLANNTFTESEEISAEILIQEVKRIDNDN